MIETKLFRKIDNAAGWIVFAIAAVVYCLTVEPTASFWDCPEFITTGYKLEVGHPPGAPFFMLTANLFTHFTNDPSKVALCVNIMSALLSAVTILFLFWSITHLTRKLILKNWDDLSLTKVISIEAAGIVGALIYTFSDTFWFSAVEGEVYAYSSAFTAVVFWLILKWEDNADDPRSDRWLVLIAYMTGLSIGVHLLNLLCIPAIVLVYCYRRFPNIELKGSMIALCISFVIVAAVLYGVVPGVITIAGWFELFFVNTLHCPFNTGLIVYLFLLVAVVSVAIYESARDKSEPRQRLLFILSVGMLGIPFVGYGWNAAICGLLVMIVLWFILPLKDKQGVLYFSARIKNTVLFCLLMLMIGYSSYALALIRSSANPPMDQNSPEDVFSLSKYLSRDQYGDRPLLYGQAYTSEVALDVEGNMCIPRSVEGAPEYQRKEKENADERDSYHIVGHKNRYVYAQNMFFPRMHDADKAEAYESWMGGVKGREVPFDRCGEPIMVKMPTQLENIRFFLSYQCNFMYWRYFMWNFCGRQNSIQGQGECEHGNWITGLPFIDNLMLGDQSLLPDTLKNDKGHNVYYCLPLLLGLIGMFWQAWRGRRGIRQFWVVFFLFFMTGLAIVVYLNQNPLQVRERDYAYAGSFYAFAIWCGMGVSALIDMANKKLKKYHTMTACIISAAALLIPLQMASQNWDDHDRSGRYTCRDFGQNYLMSLQDDGNPVIFTNGDNDTFPLWYNQDVEGFRTDARVCNLSYLQTDWYVDQMRRPAYDSPALPIEWERIEYCSGTNDIVRIRDMKQEILDFYEQYPEQAIRTFGDEPFEINNILKYWIRAINSDHHFIPTDTIYLNIDKQAVKESGMMMAADSIPDRMYISLKGKRMLTRSDLMLLELLAKTNWRRPLYIAQTVGEGNYLPLGDHLMKEGLGLRIVPFNLAGRPNLDVEKTYKCVMERFKWGNVKKTGIYLDESIIRMCVTHRLLLLDLADELIVQGDLERAKKVLAKMEEELPSENVPVSYVTGGLQMAGAFQKVGDEKKAMAYLNQSYLDSHQYLEYYFSLSDSHFYTVSDFCLRQIYIMNKMSEGAAFIDKKMSEMMANEADMCYDMYLHRTGHAN